MKKYNSKLISELLNSIDSIDQIITDKNMEIAVIISDYIINNNISKIDFINKLNISILDLEIWLSGTYDFKISEIIKFKYLFNIEINI